MDSANPREVLGGNHPPLDAPDQLEPRLVRDFAPLVREAAQLELDRFSLPEAPATDAENATLSDMVLKLKNLSKRMDDLRMESGRPYLDGQKIVNAYAKTLTEPLGAAAEELTKKVGIYNRAKAEREAAERREQERLQREEADRLEREARAKREEAEAQQRAADEAAQRIRQAASAEERAAAEAEMRQAETHAELARDAAETASEGAAKADRRADAHGRAADGDVGKLSRVSAGGSTSTITTVWAHAIKDAEALMKSLGPLGPYISNTEISAALSRATTEQARAGTIETFAIPGVGFHRDTRTNIRSATRGK
jgi:hypothetical protein